jgi:hypothetical protein
MMRRILELVEEPRRNRWMEVTCAALLAVATTASAWCAYQSNLWGGVQTFRLADSDRAEREVAELKLMAVQNRAFDAEMVIHFISAKMHGDEKLATFLSERFRAEAKVAVDAWMATDPFNNPNAPKRPFEMKEYVQHELAEIKKYNEIGATMQAAAQAANEHSDRYVLLTVLFASVLFFGGIRGTFQSSLLRLISFTMAFVLFCLTLVVMGAMPICRE